MKQTTPDGMEKFPNAAMGRPKGARLWAHDKYYYYTYELGDRGLPTSEQALEVQRYTAQIDAGINPKRVEAHGALSQEPQARGQIAEEDAGAKAKAEDEEEA